MRSNSTSYFYNFRRDVYDALGIRLTDYSNILELGCGDAITLKHLKVTQNYIGIDSRHPLNGDSRIKKMDLNAGLDFKMGTFDLIIANDVLEHLQRPEKLLRDLKNYCTDQSLFVISIPNFLYIDNLFDIIKNLDFKYRKEGGILDETHLRFYTRKSIVRMLSQSGYVVRRIEPINGVFDKMSRLSRMKRIALTFVFFARLKLVKEFGCLQWALIVQKND